MFCSCFEQFLTLHIISNFAAIARLFAAFGRLRMDNKLQTEIDQRVSDFISAVWTLLHKKTGSAANSAQERLNAVWDLIFELPVYRSLRLDTETSRN